jgi:hypothetical protein
LFSLTALQVESPQLFSAVQELPQLSHELFGAVTFSSTVIFAITKLAAKTITAIIPNIAQIFILTSYYLIKNS